MGAADEARGEAWLARAPRLVAWGLVGLALALLSLRLGEALQLLMGSELNGDIARFISGARAMRFFYDSGYREPLHVLCIKLGLWLHDDPERAVRVVSALQTLFAAGMVYLFVSRFFGRLLGLLALYLFAINPIVIFYGVQGLRAPLFTGLLLAFAVALFHPWRGRARLLGAILCGALAALLVLTRIYALLTVGGALGLYLLHHRAWRSTHRLEAVRFVAVTAAVAAVLVLPELVLWEGRSVDDNVNFLRNLERLGHPGDWRNDPPVSLFRWVFLEHSPREIVTTVVGNYLRYGYQYLPFFMRGYAALAWLFPVGVLAALLSRRGFVVGVLVLVLGPPVFFLHLDQIPGATGVESRLVYQAFPFAVALALFGVVWPVSLGLRLVGRRLPERSRVVSALAQALVPSMNTAADVVIPPAPRSSEPPRARAG